MENVTNNVTKTVAKESSGVMSSISSGAKKVGNSIKKAFRF